MDHENDYSVLFEKKMTDPFTIIIVEDDIGLGKLISRSLQRENLITEIAHTGEEAIAKTIACSNPLLLLDYRLTRISAIQLIRKLKSFGDLPPFLVMTGQGDENIAVEMMKEGAIDYLVKDVRLIEILPDKIMRACKDITHKRTLSKMEAELVKAGKEWQTTFEATIDGVFILDSDQIILQCNKSAGKILDRSTSDIIGLKCCDVVHGTELPVEDCPFSKAKKSRQREQMEISYGDKFLEISLDPIMDEAGEVTGAVQWIRDITELKIAELELIESEERYRLLATNSSDVIYRMSIPDGKYEYVSPSCMSLFGYSPDDFYNAPILIQKVIHPDWQQYFENEWRKLIDGNLSPTYEYQIIHGSGETRWLHQRNVLLSDENGNPNGIQGTVSDITDRKNFEEELQKSKNQLRDLVRHMNNLQETERVKISREVHDIVGQALTGLNLDIFWIKKHLKNEEKEIEKKIQDMSKIIDETIKTIQKISSELRPGMLDEVGVKYAIEYLLKELSNRTSINTELKVEPEECVFREELGVTLYRVTQEALTNIARHSKATKVIVMLKKSSEHSKLIISDNGIGIKDEDINRANSLGLLGMRERIMAHNGELKIKGIPNQGTEIEITFSN